MKLSLAVRTATRPRRARFTLIGTNENMTIEFRQCSSFAMLRCLRLPA
jgi:hypothetical protein